MADTLQGTSTATPLWLSSLNQALQSPQMPQIDPSAFSGLVGHIAKLAGNLPSDSITSSPTGATPVDSILPHLPANKWELMMMAAPVVGASLVKGVGKVAGVAGLEGEYPRPAVAPTYYSNVLNAFENPKIPNTLTREQALSVLKSPGVKSEENKWLGLEEKLGSQSRWQKSDIAQYIRDNQIDVNQISTGDVKQGWNEFMESRGWTRTDNNYVSQVGDDIQPHQMTSLMDEYQRAMQGREGRYSQYTLPGGSNYREVKLQWANAPKITEPVSHVRLPDGTINPVYGTPEYAEQYAQRFGGEVLSHGFTPVSSQSPLNRDYIGPHFDDPNILAHLRLNDRVLPDGRKILFAEEIQSDWQKALREQDKEAVDPTSTWDYQASKSLHDKGLGEYAPLTKDDFDDINSGQGLDTHSASVPDAPLARNYHELAMKRLLRMGAEEGYDGVGWTTGSQQAARYNKSLLDNVSGLEYHPGTQTLRITKADGSTVDQLHSVSDLPGVVGSDLAKKLLADVTPGDTSQIDKLIEQKTNDVNYAQRMTDRAYQQRMEFGYDPEGSHTYGQISASRDKLIQDLEDLQKNRRELAVTPGSVSGENMKVGERGYSDLYDRQLRDVANRYGKKFGAQVGTQQIPILRDTKDLRSLTWDDAIASPGLSVDERKLLSNMRTLYGEDGTRVATTPIDALNRVNGNLHVWPGVQTQHLSYIKDAWQKKLGDVMHPIHFLPLTPALKSSAISQGFPLFQVAAPLAAGAAAASQMNSRQKKAGGSASYNLQ